MYTSYILSSITLLLFVATSKQSIVYIGHRQRMNKWNKNNNNNKNNNKYLFFARFSPMTSLILEKVVVISYYTLRTREIKMEGSKLMTSCFKYLSCFYMFDFLLQLKLYLSDNSTWYPFYKLT